MSNVCPSVLLVASPLFPCLHIHISTSLSAFLAQDAGQVRLWFPSGWRKWNGDGSPPCRFPFPSYPKWASWVRRAGSVVRSGDFLALWCWTDEFVFQSLSFYIRSMKRILAPPKVSDTVSGSIRAGCWDLITNIVFWLSSSCRLSPSGAGRNLLALGPQRGFCYKKTSVASTTSSCEDHHSRGRIGVSVAWFDQISKERLSKRAVFKGPREWEGCSGSPTPAYSQPVSNSFPAPPPCTLIFPCLWKFWPRHKSSCKDQIILSP